MIWDKKDIQKLDRVFRLNLINSITGIKPANLIATKSKDGGENVAIFSSVVHLGSDPALLGFMLRPKGEVRRHTHENILETGVYTINHVHERFIKQAHYTSAKLDAEVSEFDKCQLTPKYRDGFEAPFVAESYLKIGLEFREEVPIKLNNTSMMIGEVSYIEVADLALEDNGYIDLEKLGSAGISGLNRYYSFHKLDEFPYVRVSEFPEFS